MGGLGGRGSSSCLTPHIWNLTAKIAEKWNQLTARDEQLWKEWILRDKGAAGRRLQPHTMRRKEKEKCCDRKWDERARERALHFVLWLKSSRPSGTEVWWPSRTPSPGFSLWARQRRPEPRDCRGGRVLFWRAFKIVTTTSSELRRRVNHQPAGVKWRIFAPFWLSGSIAA